MPDVTDVWTLLQGRRRTDGGLPLVTYVDSTTGERTELSATSVENAASKIANALRDEFDLEPGSVVGLHLPLHWQRATWCAGIWTAGCIAAPGALDADLVVAAPSTVDALSEAASAPVVVVSLHPFGLPITSQLPPGCSDATITVRQQPDAYLFDPPQPTSAALLLDGVCIDQAEVLDVARQRGEGWGLAAAGRLLVDDAVDERQAWLASLAVPLSCHGSVVIVSGRTDIERIAAQEQVTARAR